ncbi:MAG: IS66 family insertion sequence element accessory protein TnpB [Planctomycetota bacterium]|jgi:transposase|nr:IS66 family insertion sequence element accessory protein TnpB [Planctomycetota bacterium]
MLSIDGGRRIFLAREPTDMRKSFNTLSALVTNDLGEDPLGGDVFVFLSRDRRRVKVLVWEISGFWLCAKRLESGRFSRAPLDTGGSHRAKVQLSPAEMRMLLEGINVHHATYHQHYAHGQ